MKTKRATPRWLRRAPWEHSTTALIGIGLAMLMQPWSLDVYSYGFTVLLRKHLLRGVTFGAIRK